MNRRELLKGAMALCAVPRLVRAQGRATPAIVNAGGANVVVFASSEGAVLVDSGPANSAAAIQSALGGAKVQVLFNTHYHLDQTANNELFASQGAKIISQKRTREWLSRDYWDPSVEKYVKARPKGAWPVETFVDKGSLKIGGEQIDYGYLLMAHTSGDAYFHFKNANLIAVGDVASPVRDPELDWFTGGWVGGRVDSMDLLLSISNDQTKFIPAYGPAMTKAEFKAERDLMEEVRQRIYDRTKGGEGPQDMLEGGALDGLPRKWQDPMKFLYAAAKGGWAYHDKLGSNVV